MSRTIIQGGSVYTPSEKIEADLIIEGERIAGLMINAPVAGGDTVIDARGLLVFPGIVDAHTHIQLDTGIYKTADDWYSGSKAAAAGGTTTVIDFANQIKGRPFDEALAARQAESAPSIVDYNYHLVITDPDRLLGRGKRQNLAPLLEEGGVNSVKLFTTYRPNYYLDDAQILRVFEALPGDMVAMIHCENDAIVSDAIQRLKAGKRTGLAYHGMSRPAVAEAEAVGRMIRLLSYIDSLDSPALYIAHCTNAATLDELRAGRNAPTFVEVFGETCPQYLQLDRSRYEGPHPERYILQPPLRDSYDQEALYFSLLEGDLSVISTDSCDFTLAQKQASSHFYDTPGGLPGLELLLPLVYTQFAPFEDFHTILPLLTANPARIFGLYPQKGVIQPGSDADVVLYDPTPTWKVEAAKLHHVAGYSPYEGMSLEGHVVMTIARGEVIYRREGDWFAPPGRGKYIKAGPFLPPLSRI